MQDEIDDFFVKDSALGFDELLWKMFSHSIRHQESMSFLTHKGVADELSDKWFCYREAFKPCQSLGGV